MSYKYRQMPETDQARDDHHRDSANVESNDSFAPMSVPDSSTSVGGFEPPASLYWRTRSNEDRNGLLPVESLRGQRWPDAKASAPSDNPSVADPTSYSAQVVGDPDYDPSQDPNSSWWQKFWEPITKHGNDPLKNEDNDVDDSYSDSRRPDEKLDEILKKHRLSEAAKSAILAFLSGLITAAVLIATLKVTLPAAAVASILALLGVTSSGSPGVPGTYDEI